MPAALISTADAKTHLRVYHTQDDAYISTLVTRVVAEWEEITHYPLAPTDCVQVLDAAPSDGVIRHAWGGVDATAGGQVEYTDAAGTPQLVAVATEQYRSLQGWVELPLTDAQLAAWLYPITYTYTAGTIALPSAILTALLIRIGYLYAYRGDEPSPPDERAWLRLTGRYRVGALL